MYSPCGNVLTGKVRKAKEAAAGIAVDDDGDFDHMVSSALFDRELASRV